MLVNGRTRGEGCGLWLSAAGRSLECMLATDSKLWVVYLRNPVLHGLLLILSTAEGWKAESA